MFDSLASLSANAAVNTAYYAVRILRHRYGLRSPQEALGLVRIDDAVSKEELRAAEEVIHEIEQREQRSFSSLDSEIADRYAGELAEYALERSRLHLQPDLERGAELLERMRSVGLSGF